jgi:hypothetical protein
MTGAAPKLSTQRLIHISTLTCFIYYRIGTSLVDCYNQLQPIATQHDQHYLQRSFSSPSLAEKSLSIAHFAASYELLC